MSKTPSASYGVRLTLAHWAISKCSLVIITNHGPTNTTTTTTTTATTTTDSSLHGLSLGLDFARQPLF